MPATALDMVVSTPTGFAAPVGESGSSDGTMTASGPQAVAASTRPTARCLTIWCGWSDTGSLSATRSRPVVPGRGGRGHRRPPRLARRSSHGTRSAERGEASRAGDGELLHGDRLVARRQPTDAPLRPVVHHAQLDRPRRITAVHTRATDR